MFALGRDGLMMVLLVRAMPTTPPHNACDAGLFRSSLFSICVWFRDSFIVWVSLSPPLGYLGNLQSSRRR